jgi:hypothetical protein
MTEREQELMWFLEGFMEHAPGKPSEQEWEEFLEMGVVEFNQENQFDSKEYALKYKEYLT